MSSPRQVEELMDLDQLAYEPSTPVVGPATKTALNSPFEVLLSAAEFDDLDDSSDLEFNLMDFFEDEYD